jgi:phytoene synthase
LLEGFLWDANGRGYETLEEVHDYAARVAGTVGAMMALVMGVRDEAALSRACDLGVAMQLTNIARDVGEDARNGRLYLPRQWLRDAGIDPQAWLAAPNFDPAIAAIVQRLLDAADALYRRAEHGIAGLPRDCRPAIHAARLVYAEIGREIERNGLDCISRRAVVSGRRKLALIARAAMAALVAPVGAKGNLPVLPAVQFLVAAAAISPDRPGTAARSFDERVGWVIQLCERQSAQQRALR